MSQSIPDRLRNTASSAGSCAGKQGYPNGALAARTAKKDKYRGTTVYRCLFCGQFHIGRKPASVRRKDRA